MNIRFNKGGYDFTIDNTDGVQESLDKHLFYLRTLYDVSRDIFGHVEADQILRKFLLMAMGNFGCKRGFIVLASKTSMKFDHFLTLGYMDREKDVLRDVGAEILDQKHLSDIDMLVDVSDFNRAGLRTELIVTFMVQPEWQGIFGLGSRLVDAGYSRSDQAVLGTLVNDLVVVLKHAMSFAEIKKLNKNLQEKNTELQNALHELKAAMRRVEILEGVKTKLSKFVPATVSRLIDKTPTGSIPDRRRQDLSILFLDIEGYTRLCEKLGSSEVAIIIEKHFSVFMDAIHANHGDVNETAGDGLMVLFLNENKKTNAMEAVKTAQTIQEELAHISDGIVSLYKPLEINIGINSGKALVGAAKFDSIAGSRWTYTARGSLINVAARIGSMAKGGQTLLSGATAARIKDQMDLKKLGKFPFKNIKEKVSVYQLL